MGWDFLHTAPLFSWTLLLLRYVCLTTRAVHLWSVVYDLLHPTQSFELFGSLQVACKHSVPQTNCLYNDGMVQAVTFGYFICWWVSCGLLFSSFVWCRIYCTVMMRMILVTSPSWQRWTAWWTSLNISTSWNVSTKDSSEHTNWGVHWTAAPTLTSSASENLYLRWIILYIFGIVYVSVSIVVGHVVQW